MQIVHFTPPQIARIFGVNETTIKRWIQSKRLMSVKTSGGHYRVSKEQLADFVNSYEPDKETAYTIRRLLMRTREPESWKTYYTAILTSEYEGARTLLREEFISGKNVIEIFDEYVSPVLRHIGDQWTKHKISIFEEHKMSFAISNDLMALGEMVPEPTSKKAPKCIIACTPSENHVIPSIMLDIVFKKHGFRRENLGINIPVSELNKAITRIKPNVVCISKIYSEPRADSYLSAVKKYIKNKDISLILGGRGWDQTIRDKSRKDYIFIEKLKELDKWLAKN